MSMSKIYWDGGEGLVEVEKVDEVLSVGDHQGEKEDHHQLVEHEPERPIPAVRTVFVDKPTPRARPPTTTPLPSLAKNQRDNDQANHQHHHHHHHNSDHEETEGRAVMVTYHNYHYHYYCGHRVGSGDNDDKNGENNAFGHDRLRGPRGPGI